MLGNIKKSEIGSGFNKINANSIYMHTQIGVRFVLDDFLDLTLWVLVTLCGKAYNFTIKHDGVSGVDLLQCNFTRCLNDLWSLSFI